MKNIRMKSKGFTLIELMVVISIIGMLSSVVFASLSTARDRARIAAGQMYDSGLYRAKGVDVVANFKLDEGSGTTIADSSGTGNTPTLTNTNGGNVWSNNTYNNKGSSMYFDGSTYLHIPNIGDQSLSPRGFSYSAWINQQQYPPGNTDVSVIMGKNTSTFGTNSAANGGKLYFSILYGSQVGNINSQSWMNGTQSISLNEWHQVAVTVDETGRAKIYVDGKLDKDSGGPLFYNYIPGKDVRIGSLLNNLDNADGNNGYAWRSGAQWKGFVGYIDDVKMYNYTLTTSQIEKMYAEAISEKNLANDSISK